ncbi:MAG: hypothetical protein EBT78_17810 [Betaproteobacteria bacterium]|nr:hypothetical protein [Betaproteobacteria bacterium]NBT69607.1 hypothetical protein [Betaproteobacteria bacterium]
MYFYFLQRLETEFIFPRILRTTLKLVVGLASGGPTDLIARIIAKPLSDQILQSIIVENKVGAGGSIAAEFVARSEPDGYTLLWAIERLLAIA